MSFKSLIARLLQTARNQVFKLDDLAIKQGIKFADKSLDTFENNIGQEIGGPLPIDFSIEELLGDKLISLSNKALSKIEARSKLKSKERIERVAEREELERARSARHEQALTDIRNRYAERIAEIDLQTDTSVRYKTVTFNLPPEEKIIGSYQVTTQPEPYSREFLLNLSPDISGDFENLPTNPEEELLRNIELFTAAGATPKEIELIRSGYADISEIQIKKKGGQSQITQQEAKKLKKQAKLQYQAELEEERLLWEEEKEEYREIDRNVRDEEKEKRDSAKEKEKQDKKDARELKREQRPDVREAKRKKRQEEKEKKKETKEEEAEKRRQEKELLKQQERFENERQEDAIEEIRLLRRTGEITKKQERDLIQQIKDQKETPEKRQRKFDTSALKNPALIRLTYETSYQFLSEDKKQELSIQVGDYIGIINQTLIYSSILRDVIITTQGILVSLGKTGQTLNIAGNAVNSATNAITSLPIPTGAPVGVGLPLNIITGLSSNLDQLKETASKIDGAGQLINDAAEPINEKLEDVLDVLSTIEFVITVILDILNFLIYVANSAQVPIEEIQQQTNDEIAANLNSSGNESNIQDNESDNEDLLSRLQFDSTNPYFYKGFRLIIKYKIDSNSGLTQSQINAFNSVNGVSLSTDLSFTTSYQTLVKEMEFQIDNYNLIFISDPIETNFDTLVEIDDISQDVDVIVPEIDLPERFTRKEIREQKRKDRRQDRKERKEGRKSGEITRREARKDRKQDRKDRKQEAKDRRRNRIRKKEN